MQAYLTSFILIMTLTYTHLNFSMRSMADQPLTSTNPKNTQEVQQTRNIQSHRTPRVPTEHHAAIRTPVGVLSTATSVTQMPDLEHDVHMIAPHIGKVVPRDYAHWTFE